MDQETQLKVVQDEISTIGEQLTDGLQARENSVLAFRKQQRLSRLKKKAECFREIQSSHNELCDLTALADSSNGTHLYQEILPEVISLKDRVEALEREILLSEPLDANSAGFSGTFPLRSTIKKFNIDEYVVKTVDESPGDIAGFRHKTLLVKGRYAYGYAQFESGVHRLVRMSPFDSAGQRHTSFASVQVSPFFEESNIRDKIIELRPGDLKITTMRSQGAGGQHVNKTETAVRIVHLPTNIVVSCQQERSQARNRALALSLLRAKLYDMDLLKKAQSKASSHNNLPDITWGSQIRSYTLQPYQLIKDLRTGHEVGTGRIQAVLDGDLDGLMEACLKHFRTPRL
ncbi:peptide chain release factor 2 [Rickenella mellea]|uniref:Peptide chain release factor 2 n=1 Tax=Rickenella mellea TaxID=50990 RepID=A0A4Y7PVL2_9AGAM|nr:peptide chain release factor 2 [Rickenella mellea]